MELARTTQTKQSPKYEQHFERDKVCVYVSECVRERECVCDKGIEVCEKRERESVCEWKIERERGVRSVYSPQANVKEVKVVVYIDKIKQKS